MNAAVAEMQDGNQTAGDKQPLVQIRGLSKTYTRGKQKLEVLHHIDLDIGYGVGDVEPSTAGWLLEWAAFRLAGRDDFPALQLETGSGVTVRVGPPGDEPQLVGGRASDLLGWLTGRAGPDGVRGAEGLVLPPY